MKVHKYCFQILEMLLHYFAQPPWVFLGNIWAHVMNSLERNNHHNSIELRGGIY